MRCRRCGGDGTIDIYPGGGFALNPGNRPSDTKQCPNCKGTGQEPDPVQNSTIKKQPKP